MYEVYIDNRRLPIPPEKIPIKYPGQNKTMNLINGEEINILHPPGLAEISLNFVIPQMNYPCAVWDGSFDSAEELISHFQSLQDNRSVFEFIVIREGPRGGELFDTNMDVTLEDFNCSDDVNEGFDIAISLNLKEFRPYGTLIMDFTIKEETGESVVSESETQRSSDREAPKSYKVQKGDCLWNIAKRILGKGSRYKEIYELNRDQISNPNVISIGQVLTLP